MNTLPITWERYQQYHMQLDMPLKIIKASSYPNKTTPGFLLDHWIYHEMSVRRGIQTSEINAARSFSVVCGDELSKPESRGGLMPQQRLVALGLQIAKLGPLYLPPLPRSSCYVYLYSTIYFRL